MYVHTYVRTYVATTVHNYYITYIYLYLQVAPILAQTIELSTSCYRDVTLTVNKAVVLS